MMALRGRKLRQAVEREVDDARTTFQGGGGYQSRWERSAVVAASSPLPSLGDPSYRQWSVSMVTDSSAGLTDITLAWPALSTR